MGHHLRREQLSLSLSGSVLRDYYHKLCGKLIAAIDLLRMVYSRQRLSWYAISREIRSLSHRIQILRKMKLAHSGLDIGPVFERDVDGHLHECIRTRACSEDMRRLQQEHPWLSLSDMAVCLEGWKKGFESHGSHPLNPHSCNRVQDVDMTS
jgi:hypothetical protein